MRGLFSQITKVAGRLVMDTPKNFGEALWRFTALSAVTGLMVSAVLLWRYPRIVQRIALGGSIEEQIILDIFRRKPEVRDEALELIGNYISRWHPDQMAIVNWTTQTGIVQVWANELTTGWPTATNGVMSSNMREAVGYLIFDQCWAGEMPYGAAHRHHSAPEREPQDWLVCGMSDSYDLWGYLIVHWENEAPPERALEELETLSRHLERLLFE